MSLLEFKNLTVEFPTRRGVFTAVGDGLSVDPGEILGVVGESGAGKSTIGNAVIGTWSRRERLAGGEIYLKGSRIDTLDGRYAGFVASGSE